MIDKSALLPFPEIIHRLGGKLGKGNRSTGVCHGGNNPTALSFDPAKGIFHCFSCGAHGDAITLVQTALQTDFKGALSWLGVDPRIRKYTPSAERLKRQTFHRRLQGLNIWADHKGRELRDQLYNRNKIISYGMERLVANPEDGLGWSLLETALKGIPLDELETVLDQIDIGKAKDRLAAFREWELEK
jgi:hypothetical protein